eukprot:scaffold169446_cov15-Tisochrysis_lutea.AAC.1
MELCWSWCGGARGTVVQELVCDNNYGVAAHMELCWSWCGGTRGTAVQRLGCDGNYGVAAHMRHVR